MLFGSTILEVGIGVVFVFGLVSLICTAVRETLEAWFKTRAAFLEHGIRELLHDKQAQGLARKFYDHPLIYGLFDGDYTPRASLQRPGAWTKGGDLPSYIPARNFAVALFDIATRGPATSATSTDSAPRLSLVNIRNNILNLQNERVQRAMLTAIDTAQGDLNQAQKNLEDWYNSAMDRVSGAYKRSTQWVLFWVGLGVAVALNVNTITIAHYLYHNDDARTVLVAQAEAYSKASATTSQPTSQPDSAYANARRQLDALALPIGWDKGWGALRPGQSFTFWNSLAAPLLGWLLTAFAATLGAPFWFDLLNKMMVIRSTVKPHEKSQEEASEDRQPPRPGVADAPAPGPAAPAVVAQVPGPPAPTPPDTHADDDDDGCGVRLDNDFTDDENLPAAEGGVA